MTALWPRLEDLLDRVDKPARYIGCEDGVQRPEHGPGRVAWLLTYPDVYEIGLPNQGLQILAEILNERPDAVAERSYAPWTDLEMLQRRERIPLFSVETHRPAAAFDVLAFNLSAELVYTNLLNMIDLAGVPVRQAERHPEHPLVVVGGHCTFNPEPVADFVDVVVLGDGEDSLAAILQLMAEMKRGGARRREMIYEIARRHDWAYAPGLYDVSHQADGTVAAVHPTRADLPRTLQRCQTPDFEHAPFPVRPIVPHVEVIHDRISIEIMRGCPQRCRFCHAGYTKRPLRTRSVDRIMDMAEQMYWATGMDEFGLLSLSTADYPHLRELAERLRAGAWPGLGPELSMGMSDDYAEAVEEGATIVRVGRALFGERPHDHGGHEHVHDHHHADHH